MPSAFISVDRRPLSYMRTTLIIEEHLLKTAQELTGIKQKTALVRAGLEALIAREAAKRLRSLGGTEPQLRAIPRRHPEKCKRRIS